MNCCTSLRQFILASRLENKLKELKLIGDTMIHIASAQVISLVSPLRASQSLSVAHIDDVDTLLKALCWRPGAEAQPSPASAILPSLTTLGLRRTVSLDYLSLKTMVQPRQQPGWPRPLESLEFKPVYCESLRGWDMPGSVHGAMIYDTFTRNADPYNLFIGALDCESGYHRDAHILNADEVEHDGHGL